MRKPPTTVMDIRAQELLIKRALEGLDETERAELRALGAEDDDSFDLAAAAIDLATLPRHEELPAAVAARVLGAAGVPPGPAARDVAPRRRAAWVRSYLGWIAAAACLVLAIVLWSSRPGPPPSPPSPGAARARLLAAGGAGRYDWKGSKDPTAAHVSGDVVWSATDQRGYMRFVGLVPNDPSYQYQLWIFDETRDERFPVDGGVFDVPSSGEVIVPITAKLHVTKPTLFAITVERPGGVVVSKRERIVVTAGPS